MAKLRIQPKDGEIADRSRRLARQLTGRVFASSGGVYLVSGLPVFHKLRRCLHAVSEVPEPGHEPGPIELGFNPVQITEVSRRGLASRGRALQKWRKVMADQNLRAPKTAATRAKLGTWEEEVTFLSGRLEVLYADLRRADGGSKASSSAYVTADSVSGHAAAGLQVLGAGRHLPPLWNWYGRVVEWIGGTEALRRFFRSLEPCLETQAEQNHRLWILRIKKTFSRCQAQMQVGWQGKLHAPSWNCQDVAGAVREVMDAVPPDVMSRCRLKPPRRARDIWEYVNNGIKKCDDALAELPPQPSARHVAGAAALCALDGSDVPLPKRLFGSGAEKPKDSRPGGSENPNALVDALFAESGRDGYDLLLRALDELGDTAEGDRLRDIRKFLKGGASPEDVVWLHSHRYYSNCWDELATRSLSPGPVRKLVNQAQERGAVCEQEDIARALEELARHGDFGLAESFSEWLQGMERKIVDTAMVQTTWNLFLDASFLLGRGDQSRSAVSRWAKPPKRPAAMPDLPAETPERLRLWLDRIAYYQKLKDAEPSLPESLAKELEKPLREAQEMAYLRKQKDAGLLSTGAVRRLASLESSAGRRPPLDDRSLLPQAMEVCAKTALEAICHVVEKESGVEWNKLIQGSTPAHLNPRQKAEILQWIKSLKPPLRARFDELVQAWCSEGSRYRLRLVANADWIAWAGSRGLDVEAWMFPPPQEVSVGSHPIRLEVVHDPFRIFLMGSCFGTCLSLERENRDSVLSNAYDINKAVLYAFDSLGHVVGRKLVVVNSEGRMIGYRTYASLDDAEERKCLQSLMAAYCGTWARTCGLTLSNHGQPESLAGLFWYDDGKELWPSAAWTALGVAEGGSHDGGASGSLAALLDSRVVEAAKAHWPQCIAVLESAGLWPLTEGVEQEAILRAAPGLVEEILATAAREMSDLPLAKLVYKNARSEGGRLEALTSVALLRGAGFHDEMMAEAERFESGHWPRFDSILLEWNSRPSMETLVRHCLQRLNASAWNLVVAARKSRLAAETITSFLQRERYWFCEPSGIPLLLHFVMETTGHSLPDGLLNKIVAHSNCEDESVEIRTPRLSLPMAQWLPPLNDPANLERKFLDRMWHAEELAESFPEHMPDQKLGAVLWCLKNPGATAIRFLREHAAEDSAALLALAILNPRRFRGEVEKGVAHMGGEPAAILALFLVQSVPQGVQWLRSNAARHPRSELLHEKTKDLFLAFQTLDWEAMGPAQESLKSYNLQACLPWLMVNLWKQLGTMACGETAKLRITSKEGAEAVWTSGLDVIGLLLPMAAGLRHLNGKSAQEHCRAIHLLMQGR